MNGKSTYTIVPPSPRARAVQDEWGLYDPNQAGLKAAMRAVRAMSAPAITQSAPEPIRENAPVPVVRESAPIPMVRESAPVPMVLESAPEVSSAPDRDEEVYKLSVPDPEPEVPRTADRGAVYTLEFPTRCPQCCKRINTVRVSRLLRTQVSFTSTLPRKGYIIVCPECDGMVSAELSGLV